MSDVDVRGYLRSKGLDVKMSGKECVVPCFFVCGEHADSRKKKLYVNSEHGAWDCKVCGQQGGWRAVLEHFGDKIEDTPAAKPSRKFQINEEYLHATQDALMQNKKALAYLFERGLTLDTIEAARLGYHPKGVSLMESLPSSLKEGGFTRDELRDSGLLTAAGRDFHSGRIIIPYLSSGQVLQVRGRALDPNDKIKYATPPGDPVRLFNEDALRGAERVILVEGEVDALNVQQVLQSSPDVRARNLAVVAIAGVGSLPGGKEGFADYFEDIKRVYVAFDNDNPGKQASIKVKDLLSAKARIVELTGEVKDWSDFIVDGHHGWQDVMGLISEADMRGKRVFSVGESLRSLRKLESAAPGIKTGWRTLDSLLFPGLMPGQVTIPVANTGNGKSLWLANLAWQTRDIPTLYITLELTKEESANRLLRIARFYDPLMDDVTLDAHFPHLSIVDENRLSADDFSVLMEEFIEERGDKPRIVHVDYLGYYARGQRAKDQYQKVTDAVMQLKELAKEWQTHIVVPSQVSRNQKQGELIQASALRDSGAVEETADFLLGISRPHLQEGINKAAKEGTVGSALKVNLAKSRHGNTGRVVPLHLAPHSLAIVDDTDRVAVQRVEQEVESYNGGEKYQEFLGRKQRTAWQARQGSLGLDAKEKASGD